GQGTYISEFVRHPDLFDNRLPFHSRPINFPGLGSAHTEDNVFQAFAREQWHFWPHTFSEHIDMQIADHYVLPITDTQQIAADGTADMSNIKIHPNYDQLDHISKEVRKVCALVVPL